MPRLALGAGVDIHLIGHYLALSSLDCSFRMMSVANHSSTVTVRLECCFKDMAGIEIIGLAASVLQIADLGWKVSYKLYAFSTKVHEGAKPSNSSHRT